MKINKKIAASIINLLNYKKKNNLKKEKIKKRLMNFSEFIIIFSFWNE